MTRFLTDDNEMNDKVYEIVILDKCQHKCVCCGNTQNLEVHRMNNIDPELKFETSNSTILCHSCHDPSVDFSFHNLYLEKDNTEEQLIEYIYNWRKGNYLERWNC